MLSMIVPIHNERESVAATLEDLEKACGALGEPWEIIPVDDGSTDGTEQAIPERFREVLIRLPRNRGYGMAIRKGLERARGDWVGIIDADGSYPPERLRELWEARTDADMVVGKRDTGGIPASRKPAKWILRRLAQTLSGEPIPDLNSGFRIFRKDLALRYRGLFPAGFSLTTTLTLAFLCDGYTVQYLPIPYYKRTGKSKIRPIRDTMRFLGLILRMILLFNPMKILLPVSLALILAATGILLYTFYQKPIMDVTVTILYMLSLHIAVLGLLADLIAKRRT